MLKLTGATGQNWLREPLVHFLIGGLAVFLFSAWRGEPADPASRTITITAAEAQRLAETFRQTWQRPPTPAEVDGLIRENIRDEVYAREAIRLGLDRDDLVIRRRLRSKMEFLATSELENVRPDDRELQALLDRNPARYATGGALSFDQVYLGETGDGKAVLARLSQGADWKASGTSLSVAASMDNASPNEIDREYGSGFAAGLAMLPVGQWAGPVRSGFGMHLIRLREARMAAKPTLADARQAVENDWRAATLKAREAKAYQALLDGYDIQIEKP